MTTELSYNSNFMRAQDNVVSYGYKNSSIANGIDTTQYKALYDASCKQLLADRQILSRILMGCVPEYKDLSAQDIEELYIESVPRISEVPVHRNTMPRITGIDKEDSTVEEGKVVFDILFKASFPDTGRTGQLIIDVEAQNAFKPPYPLESRMIYYLGRLLSRQHDTEFKNDEYGKLKKVYSIWICTNATGKFRNTINMYPIAEKHIEGHAKWNQKDYDLMTGIMIGIDTSQPAAGHGLLRMLGILLSDQISAENKKAILTREFGIRMSEQLNKEMNHMCNLSEGVFAHGIEQGIKKGIKQGIEEGVEKTSYQCIKNLMETCKISVSEAMNNLKIPKDDQPKYRKWIEEGKKIEAGFDPRC